MEDWFARRKTQREGTNVYLDIIYTSVSSLHVLPQTCRDSLSGSSPLFSAACKLPFPQILRNDTHTNAPGVGWRRPSSTIFRPVFSTTSNMLFPQTLCFHIHTKNTRGWPIASC